MSSASDFVIENGVLKKYVGPGGDVVVPEGVTEIGALAFWHGSAGKLISSIVVPQGVTRIGRSAFRGCAALRTIVFPESLSELGDSICADCISLEGVHITSALLPLVYRLAFGKMSFSLIVHDTQGCKILAFASPKGSDLDNIRSLVRRGKWSEYDQELLNNGPRYRYKSTVKLLGMLGRLMSPIDLADEVKAQYIALAGKRVKDYAALAETLDCPEIIKGVFSSGILNPKTEKTLRTLVSASEHTAIAALSEMEAAITETAEEKSSANSSNKVVQKTELERIMEGLIVGKKGEQELKTILKNDYSLQPSALPVLQQSNGSDVNSPLVLAWLLTAHGLLELPDPDEDVEYPDWFIEEYPEWFDHDEAESDDRNPWLEHAGLRPEAEAVLNCLDRESFQQALLSLSDTYLGRTGRSKKMLLAYPICRYADERRMAELTKRALSWSPMPFTVFCYAVKYSDTRAAMLFAERYHELDKYAALRGVTEDELRDKYLSDVGLDAQGGKEYDLGNQTVTARLQGDLSFLFELPNRKTAKSLPKKGADETKYAAAKADFDEMRKAVKKILSSRGKVLFEDFLSGRDRPAGEWQEAYLNNPLLKRAAKLVVWAQGKKTFTLTDASPVDSVGAVYTITDKPIRVAHPMEMAEEDTAAWQKYFNVKGLKQPFAQVWEPVRKAEEIKEDRYKGCMIPYYRFKGQSTRGITVEDWDYHNEIAITLAGCDAVIERIDWGRHEINMDDRFEIKSFCFNQYTRQVNHIVAYLDRVTVWDRVRKDDLSVMDLMPGFTLAQIAEFIAAAQEANAVNVLAALLEYKNAHFADFDPMEEFTLEW